ncbi:MAG TPA: RHS repeat protein, partial [Verrucomicrobiota bacterium]|nr:RHS repeat protein [Verrucomicrobiota bacterium]
MVDALGASLPTRWHYAPNGRLAAEDGPWPNDAVSYAYNPAGRRTALTAQLPATYTWTQGYAWDGAGRLASTTHPDGPAYDLAQNLAKRTNNASGSTVSATVNALN